MLIAGPSEQILEPRGGRWDQRGVGDKRAEDARRLLATELIEEDAECAERAAQRGVGACVVKGADRVAEVPQGVLVMAELDLQAR